MTDQQHQRTIVVTDVTTPQRFVACLTAVVRSVGRDVEVVGVSARSPKLPGHLARRVRRVQPAAGQETSQVVEAEATRDRFVVVLRSDAKVAGGWLAQVEAALASSPNSVGLLGSPDPYLLAFGPAVRSTQAAEISLPPIEGVRCSTGTVAVEPVRRATRPAGDGRLTAALIVKDEEAVIAQCVEALLPAVDEVVVYDTGSTDDTVAVCERLGARVVRGFWDDDFAAARNRALALVDSEWVLSVDADEVLGGDVAALRERLRRETADLVLVPVVSTTWSAAEDGEEHRPVRLFRRASARWVGALHETVTSTDGTSLVLSHEPAPVRLLHSGYQADRMAAKDKNVRNLAIAQAQVDALEQAGADDAATAQAWGNLGRALVSAGRRAEGLHAFNQVLGLRGNPSELVQAGRVALFTALALGDLRDYDRWLQTIHAAGESDGAVALYRARLHLHHGDAEAAQQELDLATASSGVDLWGKPFDADDAAGLQAAVATARGRHEDALAVLVDLLGRRQESVPLAALLRAAVAADHPLADLARTGGEQFVARSLRDAVRLDPELADRWLEALVGLGDRRALVAGSLVATHLPLDGVLRWSLHVRQAGAAELCPLRAIAADTARGAAERSLAYAVLGDVLREPGAFEAFDAVAAGVPDDEVADLTAAIARYAPGLAVEPVTASAR
ncbi:glycosyltransferase [Angustibacter aerolatus]